MALETTLLAHGVPASSARGLAADLARAVRDGGAEPAVVGVLRGRAIVGMSDAELGELLDAAAADPARVPKLNSANLGLALHAGASGGASGGVSGGASGGASGGSHGATTVSATMELAHGAGVRVFATGGLGGVHKGLAQRLDISGDLAALARVPMVVVCSGVKSILDVESTREALETLGVPVIGFGCDRFPAFYVRVSDAGVDARMDTPEEIGAYARAELARVQRAGWPRAVVVVNPVPREHEMSRAEFDALLARAEGAAHDAGARGRDVTPRVLASLHELSGGRTLRANVALAVSNAALAGRIARAMETSRPRGA